MWKSPYIVERRNIKKNVKKDVKDRTGGEETSVQVVKVK
jgi:hypothetical protein